MNLIRLGDCRNAVQHAKLSFASMYELYSVDLGARTKCRYFSKLCANNCVLEKYKNKIKLLWTGSTDWSHIAKEQVPTGISVIELK